MRSGALLVVTLGVAALAPAAVAGPTPSVPAGFTIKTFAAPPAASPATKGADDITRLDGHDFVGFNNGVPKDGPARTGPQSSLVVEYNDDGTIANTFSVRGRVDGLGADPTRHRVIVTTNEDGNSTLHTITPTASAPVIDYVYSPDPSSPPVGMTDNTVKTGGGTDAVQVINGAIYLAASNPANTKATASFRVTLGKVNGVNTAKLAATFADDAFATMGGARPTAGKRVQLGLTDPDSNAQVPAGAPLFAGQYVLDSQADQQLVFVKNIGSSSPSAAGGLTQLPLTHEDPAKSGAPSPAGVDDIRWTGGPGGSLIVVDGKTNTVYEITGPFPAFQAFASLDTIGSAADTTEVDQLDPATGKLSPFATGFGTAKGLIWVAANPTSTAVKCPATGTVGTPVTCVITVTDTATPPAGIVTLASNPVAAGTFSKCMLAPISAKASQCLVTFTPKTAGKATIFVTFLGNSKFATSFNNTSTVTSTAGPKPPPPVAEDDGASDKAADGNEAAAASIAGDFALEDKIIAELITD